MTENEIYMLEKSYSEMKIQHTCVTWFRSTFPDVGGLLFAIPNGGARSPKSGAMRKYEGALSGVADLILLFPKNGKSSLCIEMKTPKQKGKSAGSQSKTQKDWQKLVEEHGSEYIVCNSLIEFIKKVCMYLKVNPDKYISDALRLYQTYL